MVYQAERFGLAASSLKLWADLYQRGAFRRALPVGSWQAAHELIRAAEAADDAAIDFLEESLKRSSQTFAPLADPLAVDFGCHRWLSREREEAYSDWFEWILKQLADARRIFRLFGERDIDLIERCGSVVPTIKREFTIDNGRPDLVIHFGDRLRILVEIKTKWFDPDAVADQLKRYAQWCKIQRQPTHSYFVSVTFSEFSRQYGFEPLPWRELMLRIRELACEWVQTSQDRPQNAGDIIRAAMTLAFCGAVEQTLLGLSGRPGKLITQTSAEYVNEWRARHG
jgi:hypothetical protein